MRTAQSLYEGVKLNGESQGLITYMRTDSVNLSNDALADLRGEIKSEYGAEYLPGKPNAYKTKSKNAQEAHEAIRPTSAALHPAKLKAKLSEDQFRLYELIWRRAMASQMKPALVDTVAVEFDCDGDATFRANGSVIAFPGYLRAYEESQPQGKEEKETRLPDMQEGDVVRLRGHPGRAAFHRAASALLRGQPGQGPRGLRDRPAIDLREHHPDSGAPPVRGTGPAPLHSDRHRPGRGAFSRRALRALRGLRIHRADGGHARRNFARRDALDSAR